MDNYGKAHGFTPGFCECLQYMIRKYKKRGDYERRGKKTVP